MRIGILGGSFNPVHVGHLALARQAMAELNLDRVLFMPSRVTPLKNASTLLPLALRVALLRRALRGRRGFELSLLEARRPGISYTVDTLRALKRRHPDATLYFLTGADSVRTFARWKEHAAIPKLCRFVVCSRPGFRACPCLPAGGRPGRRAPRAAGPFFHLPIDAPDVSSSAVRARLAAGRSVVGLVPPAVVAPLRAHYKRKAA